MCKTQPFGDGPIETLQEKAASVARAFEKRFGDRPRLFQAPGRINIIGEHTDYCGGLVMPAAIDRWCVVAAARNGTETSRIFSANLGAEIALDFGALKPTHQWTDYVAGVAAVLMNEGLPIPACNIWIDSDVPIGSGVSSSAALEVAIARALFALAERTADGATVARLAQRAENDFVGMPCGIMDQFASANGVEDSAILLDCRTLEAERLSLPKDHSFLLINSMVHHAHSTGEYRRRREDCEIAARTLHVKQLRDVDVTDLPAALPKLDDGPAHRCRHVVTEIARVRACAGHLRSGDVAALGLAMNASHASLRDDMQVSVEAVDRLVDMAQATLGVAGARMMGGGFGGCVIALVQSALAEQARDDLVARYGTLIGKTPDAFICRAVDGAGEIKL